MRNENRKLTAERVWEIDAYRGYRIFLMLLLHLYATVYEYFINGCYNVDPYAWVDAVDPRHFWFDWGADGVIHMSFLGDKVINAWTYAGLAGLFFVSGISSFFSRDGLGRVIKLFGAGFVVTAITFGIYLWSGEERWFIRFGAILCFACCHFIYTMFLTKWSNPALICLGILAIITGHILIDHPVYTNLWILYPFGFRQNGVVSSGHIPIFPYLGWLLFGVVAGRKLYPEKKSLIPWPVLMKLTRPLQWIGRYSGLVYIVHIVVYTVAFGAIGYIFHLY